MKKASKLLQIELLNLAVIGEAKQKAAKRLTELVLLVPWLHYF